MVTEYTVLILRGKVEGDGELLVIGLLTIQFLFEACVSGRENKSYINVTGTDSPPMETAKSTLVYVLQSPYYK